MDVGKFVTPAGAEVIEAKDNWNYSRSLLFALAIPYYHAGLRATYPFSDKVSVTGMVVNGWNDVVDNNSGKTWGLSATLKPNATLNLVQNFIGGPEQKDDSHDKRFLSDTVVTVNATSKLTLMANYDYGRDHVAGIPVTWQGVAAYARLQALPAWALIPRFEWFDDDTIIQRTDFDVLAHCFPFVGFWSRRSVSGDSMLDFVESPGIVIPGL